MRIWLLSLLLFLPALAQGGELPGKLKVKRRAKGIHEALLAERGINIAQPHAINDWLIVYAMAVNEENAAGGTGG